MAKDDAIQIGDPKAGQKGAKPANKSRMKKILLVSILIVAAGGVFGGGFFVVRNMLDKEETGEGEKTVADKLIAEAGNRHGDAAKTGESKGHGGKTAKGDGETGEEPPSLFFRPATPIKTNLRGSALKVTAKIWIEADNEETLKSLQRSEPYIMNALVMLFSGKTREDVSTEEGIEQVSREIKTRVEQLAQAGKIKGVGFEYLTTGNY